MNDAFIRDRGRTPHDRGQAGQSWRLWTLVCNYLVFALLSARGVEGQPIALVEEHFDDQSVEQHLWYNVAISPDGRNLYVSDIVGDAGRGQSALVVFSREPGTGTFGLIERVTRPFDQELTSLLDVVLSPDGKFVYAVDFRRGALLVFKRNTGTGRLTALQLFSNGVDGTTNLYGPIRAAMSPDGAALYVSSQFEGLSAFHRDKGTGRLTFMEFYDGGMDYATGGDDWIAISPDGRHLYAQGADYWDGAMGLIAYQRDIQTGALSPVGFHNLEHVAGNFQSGASGVFSPDGVNLYFTTSASIVAFQRDAMTGMLTEVGEYIESCPPSPGCFPSDVAITPDGAHLYVTSVFRQLLSYRRALDTGALTLVDEIVDDGGILGIDKFAASGQSLAISPQGTQVYVAGASVNYAHDSLAAFARDADTGGLSTIQVEFDPLTGPMCYGSMALSPDGAHFYVAADYGITLFDRNLSSGTLDFARLFLEGVVVAGLGQAEASAFSADGRYFYAAGGDGLVVTRRDPSTGDLSFVAHYDRDQPGLESPITTLALSDDGAHLYLGKREGAIAVFARDPMMGIVTFVDSIFDGQGGVDGIDNVEALVLSPDGNHLYAAGYADDAVAAFRRNPQTGRLTFIGALFNGVNGVGDLLRPSSLTISPDGRHLYAAAELAVAELVRNESSGILTFARALRQGVDGVDGLIGELRLTITPDGQAVIVHGSHGDGEPQHIPSLALFRREPVSGFLAFVGLETEGVPLPGGRRPPTMSPDGKHLYLNDSELADANKYRGRVVAFRVVTCGDGFADGAEPCDDGNLVDGDCCSPACTVPDMSCRSAGRSLLLVKDGSPDGKDRLVWKWLRGEATDVAEFGAPESTTGYAVCVYDDRRLIAHAEVPAGGSCDGVACWRPAGASGFGFHDAIGANGGITTIRLKAGALDNAKVLVKGRGDNLSDPTPPLTLPVTARLINGNGGPCMKSTFTAGEVIANRAKLFKAKSTSAAGSKVVFVSSASTAGNIGGLVGADALCASLASAAGRPGAFLAWLSDSTTSPATRFVRSAGPYVRTDGTVVADDWFDLANGTLRQGIDRDEAGAPVTGIAAGAIWTNTNPDGSAGAGAHCEQWTATGGVGATGSFGDESADWTAYGTATCLIPRRLYCFEQ